MIRYKLVQNPPSFYKYVLEPVLDSGEVVLYWDRPILTGRTIDFNRPDILLINKKDSMALIIDIACPMTSNLREKETHKVTKYKNLGIEIKHIW